MFAMRKSTHKTNVPNWPNWIMANFKILFEFIWSLKEVDNMWLVKELGY